MEQWLTIIGLSALVGFACGRKLHGVWGSVAAAAIPWFGLLVWLLYNEYFVPYQGGGASMWPVAQLFAGTIAAVVGFVAHSLTRRQPSEGVRDDT